MTTRHPILTFLVWQVLGLTLLLVYVGLIFLTGAVMVPLMIVASLVALLFIADRVAGFAVYLQFLLYQNVSVSLVSGSLSADLFRTAQGTSFALTVTLAAVAFCRLWAAGRNRQTLSYLAAAGVVILAYTALGAAYSSLGSAAVYFRSTSILLMGLLIGWDLGHGNSYRTVGTCFLVSLALGLMLTLAEVTFPIQYYEAIDAPRYYFLTQSNATAAMTPALVTGRDVVIFQTTAFFNLPEMAYRTIRFGGPNMHSVSYSYVMSVGAIVAFSLGKPWFALLVLPLMILIGVKGGLILFVGAAVLCLIGRIFGTRLLAISGLLFGVAYAGSAIVFGLSVGDYHVLGLIAGVNGFLQNPLGHGIGVGGNMSSDVTATDLTAQWALSQKYGADIPSESAIGVLLYQMGIGSVAVAYLIWTAFKAGFGHFTSSLGIVPLALAVLTVNALLQEEAFSPYSMGLLAIFAGVLSYEIPKETIGETGENIHSADSYNSDPKSIVYQRS